jgi:putative transcriptional regulator
VKNRIKIERAILKITQEELAKRISVSRQTINEMELNKYVTYNLLA